MAPLAYAMSRPRAIRRGLPANSGGRRRRRRCVRVSPGVRAIVSGVGQLRRGRARRLDSADLGKSEVCRFKLPRRRVPHSRKWPCCGDRPTVFFVRPRKLAWPTSAGEVARVATRASRIVLAQCRGPRSSRISDVRRIKILRARRKLARATSTVEVNGGRKPHRVDARGNHGNPPSARSIGACFAEVSRHSAAASEPSTRPAPA